CRVTPLFARGACGRWCITTFAPSPASSFAVAAPTPRDEPVMTAVLPARALMGTPEGSWCGRRPEPTGAGRRAVRPLGWAGARVAELADALDLGSSARGREGSSPFSRTHRP